MPSGLSENIPHLAGISDNPRGHFFLYLLIFPQTGPFNRRSPYFV
jgi:hypothetical protein